MVLNKRDLSRAFSPGKNVRRSIGKRKPIVRRPNEKVHDANVKVVIRVRPVNNDNDGNARNVIKVLDDKMLIFDPKEDEDDFYFQGMKQKCRDISKRSNKEMKFMFDEVFGPEASTEAVFGGSTKDIIGYLLDGYNCSVFVYGATGAGKTYTMLGTKDCPGITYLTMVELYRQMEALKHERKFEVAVSYLEIYNESVKDLINPSKEQLHVREDAVYGVKVQGLSVLRPNDANHLLSLLEGGNQNRSQHPTDANAESSRSHAICQVYVKMTSQNGDQGGSGEGSVIKLVKLSMIDLAGSERGSATGFKGSRFAEGANINKSLLALGNCINALADGLKHIPYRDSKLTRLLKDSLGGNCKTVMIANISPAVASYEDTYNTLKYADRAKKIKLRTKKNVIAVDMHVSELAKLVEGLRQENADLKQKLAELESGGVDSKIDELMRENAELKQKLAEREDIKGTCTRCALAGDAPIVEQIAEGNKEMSVMEIDTKDMDKTFKIKQDELTVNATSGMNSTFVQFPGVEEIVEKKEKEQVSPCKEIMKHITEIYNEREMLQKKLFQLEAENRILSWKEASRHRGLTRLQSLCSVQNEDFVKSEMKAKNSKAKIALRLSRISERKKMIVDQLIGNGRKVVELFRESPQECLPHLELKTQNLLIIGWQCVAEHAVKMANFEGRERIQNEMMLEKVSSTLHHYHCLLSGHGLLSQSLQKNYENLMSAVDGTKVVSWQDQMSSQKSELDSTVVVESEKDEEETKDKLNETFSLPNDERDKEQSVTQFVSLPFNQIIGLGLTEPNAKEEEGDVEGSKCEGEVAAVSEGLAKVDFFSSLTPPSILSSILPTASIAPLQQPFAVSSPSQTSQKNSSSIPRTFISRSWYKKHQNGVSSGSQGQRSFKGPEKSRENKENSTEKGLLASVSKASVSNISPAQRGESNGSTRKILQPRLRKTFSKPHPYYNSSRSRFPLEPRFPAVPNTVTFPTSKFQPPSAKKALLTSGESISSKLSSYGK